MSQENSTEAEKHLYIFVIMKSSEYENTNIVQIH